MVPISSSSSYLLYCPGRNLTILPSGAHINLCFPLLVFGSTLSPPSPSMISAKPPPLQIPPLNLNPSHSQQVFLPLLWENQATTLFPLFIFPSTNSQIPINPYQLFSSQRMRHASVSRRPPQPLLSFTLPFLPPLQNFVPSIIWYLLYFCYFHYIHWLFTFKTFYHPDLYPEL